MKIVHFRIIGDVRTVRFGAMADARRRDRRHGSPRCSGSSLASTSGFSDRFDMARPHGARSGLRDSTRGHLGGPVRIPIADSVTPAGAGA